MRIGKRCVERRLKRRVKRRVTMLVAACAAILLAAAVGGAGAASATDRNGLKPIAGLREEVVLQGAAVQGGVWT